jgi:DNA-binding transcriptional regulator YiaG
MKRQPKSTNGLAKLRELSQLSPPDFAAALGITLGQLRSWTHGWTYPLPPAQARVRTILNLDETEFWEVLFTAAPDYTAPNHIKLPE